MFLDLTFCGFCVLLCGIYMLWNISMAEENRFSYDTWKEYLKTDKDMKERWKSLTSLWENVSENLKNALEKLPKAEVTKRRKELTAKNIFDIINTAKQRPNFRWQRKMIWNEEDQRHEYVIQCLNPSSDWIFRKIKEERWVTNMHWESINKYLQPVTNKIWALKAALQVSSVPETNKKLWYESMKMEVDDDHEVDPDYPKAPEGWRDPVQPWTESYGYKEEVEDTNKEEEKKPEDEEKKPEDENNNSSKPPKLDKDGQQYLIDFPEFDD